MTNLAYLDASAIVKLVVSEAESTAMNRWFIEAQRVATSRVGLIETVRATSRTPVDRGHRAYVLANLEVLELTAEIADRAANIDPAALRTLDAVHLASAIALGTDVEAFVTYDSRLAAAASAIGLPVIRPA